MFFSIKNHVALGVTEVDNPAALKPRYPALVVTKDLWRRWAMDAATDHWFLSGCEGISSNLRLGADNPVFRCHCLVVDYDAELTDADVEKIRATKLGEARPRWVSRTFSNHARLIFDFERPILLSGPDHYKAFVRLATKALKLGKYHGGFEPQSLEDSAHYYDIGRQWWEVSDEKVARNLLELWAYEASKVAALAKTDYRVPLDEVKEEVNRRYPGRWSGEFAAGCRGVRFWDPSADNETAAVVTPEGMMCFTGNQSFVTWREIFGPSFVSKFEAQKISTVSENTWYDGRNYWVLTDGFWKVQSKEDFARKLRIAGFESKRSRGKTYSEIDQVEHSIQESRHVDAAAPFLYRPSGLYMYNNMRFLNTSRARCMAPVDESARPPNPTFEDLEQRCGRLLYPFLCHFFDGGVGPQLYSFLAWLKYFYINGLCMTPQQGQAVLLVGPPSAGKTFLIQGVIARIMGGYAKAGDFLSGRSKWSSELAQSPLLVMDDDEGAGPRQYDVVTFTQRVKAVVANGELMFAQKFGAETKIEWLGRILMACNHDPHAIARSLPDMDLSIRNKIMLYLTNPDPFKGFRTKEENITILADELPYFCGWLFEWVPPVETYEVDEKRFGVRAYHHQVLLDEAARNGPDELVWNIICRMIEDRNEGIEKGGSKPPETYRCDVIRLHADLLSLFPHLMRDIKVQHLVRCLQSFIKKGRPVSREVSNDGREVWVISYAGKKQ